METVIPNIPSNPRQYFLEFSSKSEYLEKRSEWRTLYQWLSKTIRHNKRVHKAYSRTFSLIVHRMVKSSKFSAYSWKARTFVGSEIKEEFKSRLKVSKTKIPERIETKWLDATDLLEIRKMMKEESMRQRKLQLV